MKLESVTFARLRRLAPVLDVVLNEREVEPANPAPGLPSLVPLRSLLKADPYVISHGTREWTADAHSSLARAGVVR